jgi:hypothetical protein
MAVEKKITTTTGLPNPIDLAKEAWLIYKARFWAVVGVYVLGYLGIIAVLIATLVLGGVAFFALGAKFQLNIFIVEIILGLLAIVSMTVLGTWISGSVISSIAHWQKKVGAKESYRITKPFIIPLLLTSVLSGLIVFGSVFIFIVPALIFGVWFSFAQYSVLLDKRSGLEALHASREYVRGRFWKVIWLMIAVHLPEIVLGMTIATGVKNENGGGLSGIFQLVSLLAIPFYQMYTYTLYKHLKKTTESSATVIPQSSKLLYLIVPAVGYILVITGVVAIVPLVGKSMSTLPTLINNFASLQKQTDNIKPGTQIVTGIVLYFAAHHEYPKDLDTLVSDKLLEEIPTFPISGLPYVYTLTSGGKDFKLCTPSVMTSQKCVTSKSGNFDL